ASRVKFQPPPETPRPNTRADAHGPKKGLKAGSSRASSCVEGARPRDCYSTLLEASSASSSATFSTGTGSPSLWADGSEEFCISGAEASVAKSPRGETGESSYSSSEV